MSFVGDFVGDTLGGITGAKQAGEAGAAAAATEAQAAMAGVDETRRQFDKLVELMSPYVSVGPEALQAQRDIIGLGGAEAQQQAISGIEQSPYFQSIAQQGENAMLQQASATGGLRGGDMQGALAQYRPQLLNQLVQQQYGNLGGLTNVGQSAAAGQAGAGQAAGANIAQLLGNQGAALAGGQLAQGQVAGQSFGSAMGIGGMFVGAGGIPGMSKLF